MTKTKFILFVILILLPIKKSLCQISEFGIPLSYSDGIIPLKEFMILQEVNVDSLKIQDAIKKQHGLKNNRFASMISIDIDPLNSGKWENASTGRIWRMGIYAKGAYSLYCIFNQFSLKNGCKLYVYDPEFQQLRGGYSYKNNTKNHVLAIAPIASDSIILELDVPYQLIDFGSLHLSTVGYDYINAFGKKSDARLKDDAESCEVDINCPAGYPWQIDKRAICRIIIGDYLCTGSLIGNTSKLRIPYFLTAYHCVLDSTTPETAIFYFNYEHTSCGGSMYPSPQTLSGSKLISMTINQLDYALLQLDTFPPLSYAPYFLGWDNSGSIPQNGAVIHHPSGSFKKITLDALPLSTSSFGSGFDPDAHWLVSQYSLGTTEPGSSGAPFLDSLHHIIGTLTGGSADCSFPDSDFYSKFSLSWNKYPDPDNQLKIWLDPSNTGAISMNGYDPYGFNPLFCDTNWNFSKTSVLEVPLGDLGNEWTMPGSTYWQFAEKFYSTQELELHGAYFDIAQLHATNSLSAVKIHVWNGDTIPETELYSSLVPLSSFQRNAITFIPFDSILKITGNFYIGYSITTLQQEDTFAVYHTVSNGSKGPSTMYLFNQKWNNIAQITSPPLMVSLGIGVSSCYGNVIYPSPVTPSLFPNPCSTYFNVKIPFGTTVTNIQCYQVSGKQVTVNPVITDGNIFVGIHLPSGVYVLKVNTNFGLIINKFIVINS